MVMKHGGRGPGHISRWTKAAGSAAAFDPATLNLDLWLDPSDLTTLFQDSGGTGAVSADSDPVGYCGDKAASPHNFTQAVSAARPLYKTSGGLKWMQFDGVTNTMDGAAISTFMTASDYDILIAGEMIAITSNLSAGSEANNGMFGDSGGYTCFVFRTATGGKMDFTNYDSGYKVATDDYTATTSFVAHIRHTGGNIALQYNSRSAQTTAAGDLGALTGTARIGRAGGAGFGNCKIFGMMARKTTLSAGELLAARTWLAAKAGVTL